MSKTLSPPSPTSVRVTVPVSSEVLEIFQRLAKAGNMSTGKAMGEWLADTVEAAEFMASKMEQARAAPKVVMREMHAYALGLADETGELMRKIAEKGASDRALSKGATPGAGLPRTSGGTFENFAESLPKVEIPPSCNTGGKVPSQGKSPRTTKRPSIIGKLPLPKAKK
jgi:NTP pyrophosphatase (non-canonical NTP hydrolase)